MPKQYKFEGFVVRLTERDYDNWSAMYHGIPDIKAELYNLDLYYNSLKEQGQDLGNWFIRTSTYLNKKHQYYIAMQKQAQATGVSQWHTEVPPQ